MGRCGLFKTISCFYFRSRRQTVNKYFSREYNHKATPCSVRATKLHGHHLDELKLKCKEINALLMAKDCFSHSSVYLSSGSISVGRDFYFLSPPSNCYSPAICRMCLCPLGGALFKVCTGSTRTSINVAGSDWCSHFQNMMKDCAILSKPLDLKLLWAGSSAINYIQRKIVSYRIQRYNLLHDFFNPF